VLVVGIYQLAKARSWFFWGRKGPNALGIGPYKTLNLVANTFKNIDKVAL
jgi:hypothetical protein